MVQGGAYGGCQRGDVGRQGFTGAPALTVESPEVVDIWANLGTMWLMTDQYFKPYAVCYWAQPAIAGTLALQRAHHLSLEAIKRIRVLTFHEATRLTCRHPQTTEEAQYNLPFPVAAALVHHQLGPAALTSLALHDPRILNLAERGELVEDSAFNARFPADRLSRVQIETHDGRTFDSGEVRARWDVISPPSEAELREKFRWEARNSLSEARVAALEEMIWQCADLPEATSLLTLLAPAKER